MTDDARPGDARPRERGTEPEAPPPERWRMAYALLVGELVVLVLLFYALGRWAS